MNCPAAALLFLDNKLLGYVLMQKAESDCGGLLVPTGDYHAARGLLQTLTVGIAKTAGDPTATYEAITSAVESLKERGLELRAESGEVIPTDWLWVGDYWPLTCNEQLLGTALLPILVQFSLLDNPANT